jgi:hypothetical protein
MALASPHRKRLACNMGPRIWHAFVNTVLKIWFPLKTEDFLSQWMTTDFSKWVELIIETCLINMSF